MLTLSSGVSVCAIAAVAEFAIALPADVKAEQSHPYHDIYRDLYANGGYAHQGGEGTPCCGGDPLEGDCEPVGHNYEVLQTGDVLMITNRFGRSRVLIAREKILWMTVRGGEFSDAHWCGRPRNSYAPGDPEYDTPTFNNPDPEFYTVCAMISPGGM